MGLRFFGVSSNNAGRKDSRTVSIQQLDRFRNFKMFTAKLRVEIANPTSSQSLFGSG